jgi:hypothetical protein
LILSNATLEGNTIQGNIAGTFREGHGGGLVSNGTNLILRGNTIAGNTACAGICTDYGAGGGGLYVLGGQATLEGNHIVGNTGCTRSWAFGGGLQLANCDAILRANTIAGNAASTGGSGHGGGLSLTGSQVVLQANTIISNTATFDHADTGRGGGLYIRDCSSLSLTNNVVAPNQANTEGSGLWVQGPTVADPAPGRLRHTTIADNAGSGQGVFLAPDTLLVFENTIIAGHSVGLVASAGSEATLEATLWYENQALTAGEGTILTGTINVYEDPAFVDPLAGDYHLGPGSAAIDAGVDAGVDDDIDGDSRPQGAGYDLGADEFLVCVAGVSIAGPATAITGPAFPFTATVTPANAALPIVYTWSPEPEGGQGTVQAIYRWVNTGSLTITVEASNSCGAATASHTVDVGLAQLRYLPLYLRHYSLSGNLLLVHLDEPSGATCFVDSSGVNEPLCCAGSSCPMAGVEGKRNAAAHFDGTDDYLGLGDKSSLNIIGEITMEAWVKVAAADGIRNIVAHGLTTTPPGEVFLRVMDDSYQVGSWDGGLSHRANYPIQDGDMGSWVFLAGVYDGQAWRLYRNGVEVSSLIASTGAVLVEDYWAIGASGNGNERFFQGSIDEVAIYGRALSPEEILEHYQQGLAGLIP